MGAAAALLLAAGLLLSQGPQAGALVLNVSAVPISPFVVYDPPDPLEHGAGAEGQFSGMFVDLLRYLASYYSVTTGTVLQLSFHLGSNGDIVNGTRGGAIGELLQSPPEAEVAIGTFSITPDRAAAGLQFTTPFLSSGIGMLTSATAIPPNMWNFVQPLALDAWMALLGCFLWGAVATYFTDRCSPFGFWRTAHEKHERRLLNIPNAIYTSLRVLMRREEVRLAVCGGGLWPLRCMALPPAG